MDTVTSPHFRFVYTPVPSVCVCVSVTMIRLWSSCQLFLFLLLLNACLPWSYARDTAPGPGFDCCEGDILLLLDSSGSISFNEFSHMLHFLAGLLRPFRVGRGNLRVALVQVATESRVEFDFNAHSSQNALQDALLQTPQLRGDTKTHSALLLAQKLLRQPAGQEAPPRVLLWITDGVEPGNVDGPVATLHKEGVSVLAVSTGHANYQVFSKAVTPPIDQHLYFVDPDYMDIITTDLREAITELICSECLGVRDVTSHSAVLHWKPVQIGRHGQYELQYGHTDSHQKLTLSPDHTWVELIDLQPDTHYSVRLTEHTPDTAHARPGKTLSTTFTTLPDVLGLETVMVSESGPDRLRVSWPLIPGRVDRYRVEFGVIPRGNVRSVTLSGSQSSVLLTELHPDAHYLITIIALYSTGQERAISVKACTQEVFPGLHDLRLTPMGSDSVKVDWATLEQRAELQGYWVKWEKGEYSSSSSSRYLPAHMLSTVITHLNPSARVCVSPVYRTARGEGLCCTTLSHAAAS